MKYLQYGIFEHLFVISWLGIMFKRFRVTIISFIQKWPKDNKPSTNRQPMGKPASPNQEFKAIHNA